MNLFQLNGKRPAFLALMISAMMMLATTVAMAQSRTVTGQVVGDDGIPMIGVTVVVEGTANGTITDIDGTYKLNNVDSASNLQFSFVGYSTVTSPATQGVIDVTLKTDSQSIDEVVVVGFGSQKKVNLTGSVATAGEEVFKERPVTSAAQALQGVVGGLNITNNSGTMNSAAEVNIRGVATIGEGSTGKPLILVDGVAGDLDGINPQDIASVSVLKDAAASSIYGSRAPFGVILITTKRGSEGKVKVNYNNSFRWSSPMNLPNIASSTDFVSMANDESVNMNKSYFLDNDRVKRVLEYAAGLRKEETDISDNDTSIWAQNGQGCNSNRDWYDLVYKDVTFGQEHNLSVSGGNKDHNIYMSTNYLKQDGIISVNTDEMERISTNFRANGKIYDWLKYGYGMNFMRKDYNQPFALDETLGMSNNAWPTTPMYDPNGYLCDNVINALENQGTIGERTDKFVQQLQLVATPMEGWNVTADFNYKVNNTYVNTSEQTYNVYSIAGDPYLADKFSNGISSVTEAWATTNYMNANLFTDYTFTVKEDHNFKAMLGLQLEQNNIRNVKAAQDGILIPGSTYLDLTSGTVNGTYTPSTAAGGLKEWATAGIFGRLNYDYKGRYLLEANLRYDGTSRFRGDKQWDWFPSFSAGWNVAQEKFWEPISQHVSMLKLRASYGSLGNQNTSSSYPTFQTLPFNLSAGNYLINGLRPNTASAPKLISETLSWETVETSNFGLDLSALNNRLTFSGDYFIRNTKNMVGPAEEMPQVLGIAVPSTNNTSLSTKGWEIALSWRDRLECGFGYSAGVTLSDSKTEITAYPNENKTLLFNKSTYNGGLSTGVPDNYYTGQTYGEIWGLTTIGVARDAAEMKAHLATLPNGGQNVGKCTNTGGDIMYADINGDGIVNKGSSKVGDSGDLSIIGNSSPRYAFGINLAADYKGFDMSAFFQGVMKRDYFVNSNSFWGITNSGIWKVVIQDAHMDYYRDADTWSVNEGKDLDGNPIMSENLDSYYPQPNTKNVGNYQVQSGYLQDASYIRLKNLQLGYTFPREWMQKANIGSLRIFISGENLWTGTSLSELFDPETIDSSGFGVGYPLSRVYSCGLNVTF